MQSTKTFNNLLLMLLISSSTATARSINTSTANFTGGTYTRGYFNLIGALVKEYKLKLLKMLIITSRTAYHKLHFLNTGKDCLYFGVALKSH